jgi:hypothetical protein
MSRPNICQFFIHTRFLPDCKILKFLEKNDKFFVGRAFEMSIFSWIDFSAYYIFISQPELLKQIKSQKKYKI